MDSQTFYFWQSPTSTKAFSGITVRRSTFHGFGDHGLTIISWPQEGSLDTNRDTYAYTTDVSLTDNHFYNAWTPAKDADGTTPVSAAGIVLNRVKHCDARFNTFIRMAGSGLWAVQTYNLTFSRNLVAYSRRVTDACANHVDIQNDDSVFEYNVGYRNEGGYFESMGLSDNNVARFGISVDDGQEDAADGDRTHHANTIFLTGYAGQGSPRVPPTNVTVHNNLIVTTANTTQHFSFQDRPKNVLFANNEWIVGHGTIELLPSAYNVAELVGEANLVGGNVQAQLNFDALLSTTGTKRFAAAAAGEYAAQLADTVAAYVDAMPPALLRFEEVQALVCALAQPVAVTLAKSAMTPSSKADARLYAQHGALAPAGVDFCERACEGGSCASFVGAIRYVAPPSSPPSPPSPPLPSPLTPPLPSSLPPSMTKWSSLIDNVLVGLDAFRLPSVEGRADAGLYAAGFRRGSTDHNGRMSSAGVGFGLLGLCFNARLGRMSADAAAVRLHETLVQFDAYWWPLCEQARLCPHWLVAANDGVRLGPWGNDQLSTIDTAIFVAAAHYATNCLQPHAGGAVSALVDKYLLNLSWAHSLPTTCDDNRMKMLVGVDGSDTRPWNEYHILVYVAAAAAAAAERRGDGAYVQDIGHCPALVYHHRYWRPDAYGLSVPGAEHAFTYAGGTLLTARPGHAVPDFLIAFVDMLTSEIPRSLMVAQATASQAYWRAVLGHLQEEPSPYNFDWLPNASASRALAQRLEGVAGVSAGMTPASTWPSGRDSYDASAMNSGNAADASGGSNPNFVYHMPSAYSFAPHVPGLREALIRMYDEGVSTFPLQRLDGGGVVQVPWQGSVRFPEWKSNEINIVDYALAAFGLPHEQPAAFANGSFVLQIGLAPSQHAPCAAALLRPIAASHGMASAPLANDGDPATVWEATGADGEWALTINLGSPRHVRNVTVHWGVAHAASYSVMLGSDGESWAAAVAEFGGASHAASSAPSVTTPTGDVGAAHQWLRITSHTNASLPAAGWALSALGTSCTAACASDGRHCVEDALDANNGAVDSMADFSALLTALDPPRACSSGTTNYGSNTNVPSFAPRGASGAWCAVSSAARPISSFDCDASPPSDQSRVCFCSQPAGSAPSFTRSAPSFTPRGTISQASCALTSADRASSSYDCAATADANSQRLCYCAPAAPCKQWCSNNKQPWTTKCTWNDCKGCAGCLDGSASNVEEKDGDDALSSNAIVAISVVVLVAVAVSVFAAFRMLSRRKAQSAQQQATITTTTATAAGSEPVELQTCVKKDKENI